MIPAEASKGYDVMAFIRGVIDEGSFFEIKRLFAREIVCGFARIDGHSVGVLASQPRFKGGVLFVDSADKATRFITCCDAFNVPLLFLADVPGFMIGTAVERQGIIRHGAKMIAALAQAQVPRISVILRKAYGAGLYAMSGPAFEPDCTLALPTAQIAVMGPEAAINAVYYNKIQDTPEDDRAAFVKRLQDEYRDDIDIFRLASELIVDAVVPPDELRGELVRRFAATGRDAAPTSRDTIPFRPSERTAPGSRSLTRSLRLAARLGLLRGRALCRCREPRRPASRGDHADHGGGLCRHGAQLSIVGVIAAAIIGAVVGDNIGFGIGWFGGYPLLRRFGKYVRLDEPKLKVGRYIFMRHGAKVVFFGRFVSILRTYVAFLAGTNRMQLDPLPRRQRAGGDRLGDALRGGRVPAGQSDLAL